MRRRHHNVWVGGNEPGEHLAGLLVAGHDRPPAAVEFGRGRLVAVEPQPRLLRAWAVAGVAVLGQDRPDVAVKPDGRLVGGRRGCRDD